jgi:hypothetical protein
MNATEYFENYAIKRTILPISIYLVLTFLIFFIGNQITEGAQNYLNQSQLNLVNSFKIAVYIMLSSIWLFIIIFNKNLLEVSALQQFTGIFKTSPYPVMIIRIKDQTIITSSLSLSKMLDYGNKEILNLSLNDILTEKSIKDLESKKNTELTHDQNLNEIQFISKDKNQVKTEISLYPFELSGSEYLIIRCKSNDEKRNVENHIFHF